MMMITMMMMMMITMMMMMMIKMMIMMMIMMMVMMTMTKKGKNTSISRRNNSKDNVPMAKII